MAAIDLATLEENFTILKGCVYTAPVEVTKKAKALPKSEAASASPTPPTKPRKTLLRDFGTIVGDIADHTTFVITIVDKALQVSLYSISSGDDLDAAATAFIRDLQGVAARLEQTLPGALAGAPSFFQLVKAVEVMYRCLVTTMTVNDMLPSEVRASSQLINTAYQHRPPFRLAVAMMQHTTARKAMDEARSRSAVGLQDQTTDQMYDQLHDRVETELSICFEQDPEAWATTGANGNAFTATSFVAPLDLASSAMITINVAMAQWSAMRLEERRSDVALVFQSLATISAVGSFAASLSLHADLPELLQLLAAFGLGVQGQQAETTTSTSAPASGDDHQHGDEATTAGVDMDKGETKAPDANDERRQSFKKLTLKMPGFKDMITKFMERVCDTAEQLNTLGANLVRKLGVGFQTDLEEMELDLATILSDAWENKQALETICSYIQHLALLSDQVPLKNEDATKAIDDKEDYLQWLSAFCAAHRLLHEGSGGHVKLCAPFEPIASHMLLPKLVRDLTTIGEMTFREHSTTTLQYLVNGVRALEVQPNLVESGVVEKHPQAEALFCMIISTPKADILSATVPDAPIDANATLSMLTPQVLFSNLRLLVDALDVNELHMPGVSLATGGTGDRMELETAMKYLELVAAVRSLVTIAAALHVRLAEPMSCQRTFTNEAALIHSPALLASMGDALVIVIKVCASPKANDMESVGWILPVSFAVGRQLASAMGCFYKRMTTLTLEYWSNMLQAASATVSSTCPSFGSCMSDATFDEELAIAITANKLTPVVQAHNSLHKLMTDMASASESISLTPRLQDHAATKGAIAVARHALQLAKDATIVVRGVAMLRKVKNIRDGPSQIKKFLTEIPVPRARRHPTRLLDPPQRVRRLERGQGEHRYARRRRPRRGRAGEQHHQRAARRRRSPFQAHYPRGADTAA